jgi:hypothetical protein
VGVLGPQGTDSGPRAHLGRGYEPAGGGNILSPRNLSESLCVGIPKRWCSMTDTWRPMIRADVGIPKQWCSTADTWRPTIRAIVAMLTEPSHAAVPRGPLLLIGNREARGNHDHDPRIDGTPRIRDAWGFCFSAAAPPFRCPVPTDERGMDSLVNAWVCGARGVGTKRHARWAATYRGG